MEGEIVPKRGEVLVWHNDDSRVSMLAYGWYWLWMNEWILFSNLYTYIYNKDIYISYYINLS